VRDVGGPPLSGHAVRSHWLDGGTASRHRPVAAARRRRPTAHVALCTALPHLGAKVTFLTDLKLGYKKVDAIRHARCRATKPPLPPPSVLTASSTLRPLAPLTRAASACPRTPCRSPSRLLARPSCQLAGVTPPAAAAGGLRHGRPPVPIPPQVSTQIEPMRTLDHFPPLPRPSPPPASSESGRPHRPCPLGLHCKALETSREFCANRGQICELFNLFEGLVGNGIFPF
jgi:hypothetical protein